MNMGIKGAALATGIGQLIPAVAGLVYFSCFHGSLHFVCPKFRFRVLMESCINGSSEMVTNLSTAVVTYLFNMTMLKFLGETGVAAITIVLYGQFLFTAMYMGFSMGVAPVISYNYGRDNRILLRRIFKICIGFISVSSVTITAIALLSTSFIVQIFTPVETETYAIAKDGFFLFSINYIFAGVNIFASSMFTAFSDGKTSAIISFVRTFVLLVLNISSPCHYGGDRHMACCTSSRVFNCIRISFILSKKKKYLPLCIRKELPYSQRKLFFIHYLYYSAGIQFTDRLKNL